MYDVLLYSCGICMPCMYPQILCNVDVMIATLQKRLQDALLSLVGPSSSFWIGSHLGRDIYKAKRSRGHMGIIVKLVFIMLI